MANKAVKRDAIAYLRKTDKKNTTLFALIAISRGGKFYIVREGKKNTELKVRINTFTYNSNCTELIKIEPNFEEVEGELLCEMFNKQCISFINSFSK